MTSDAVQLQEQTEDEAENHTKIDDDGDGCIELDMEEQSSDSSEDEQEVDEDADIY